MSHFCGLVFLTPDYAEHHDLDESLEKYDENRKVPEYADHVVTEYEKATFLSYYCPIVKKEKKHEVNDTDTITLIEDTKVNRDNDMIEFMEWCKKERENGNKQYELKDYYKKKYSRQQLSELDYAYMLIHDHRAEFGKFWFDKYPELVKDFDKVYKECGDGWNGNSWRINPENGLWTMYSEYNPDSKFDYYCDGGRWSGMIKTKDGSKVDEAYLDEIDWYAEADAYNLDTCTPFCIVIDGVWYEKGEMGWWAMTSNEKTEVDWKTEVKSLIESLPEDTIVYNMDFHI